MLFNSKKSVCCRFGAGNICVTNMKLGSLDIEWVNSFKYLGVIFFAGLKINIDCQVTKRKFYAACNSVLSHCRRNDNLVKLHLVKSFCLPLLTYCLGAVEVPHHRIIDLGVCWNDCFRKKFGYHRWESVKELQWFLNELPFEYIYDLSRWRFLTNRKCIPVSVALLLDINNLQHGHLTKLSATYDAFRVNSNKADSVMSLYINI